MLAFNDCSPLVKGPLTVSGIFVLEQLCRSSYVCHHIHRLGVRNEMNQNVQKLGVGSDFSVNFFLYNKKMSITTMTYVQLSSLVISIFLYACESWTLTAEQQRNKAGCEASCGAPATVAVEGQVKETLA